MNSKNARKWIDIILLIILISYLLSYFGIYHWILDVFSHFRAYYLFFFTLLFAYYLYKKKMVKVLFFSIPIVLILIEILPFYIPIKKVNNKEVLKISSINLLSSNTYYDSFITFIKNENPDIFLVMELTSKWETKIASLKNEYRFYKTIPRDDNFGIGLFSKLPFTEITELWLNDYGLPSIKAKFLYQNDTITLIGTHPLPPAGSVRFNSRNSQFEKINTLVKENEKYTIILGDLNCTTYSGNINRLIKNTGLKDTRTGFGFQNTWHANIPFLSIPIDHCFVTADFEVNNRRTGSTIGSDHLPIIIELVRKTN